MAPPRGAAGFKANSLLVSAAGYILLGEVSQGLLPSPWQLGDLLGAGRPNWAGLSPGLYGRWLPGCGSWCLLADIAT